MPDYNLKTKPATKQDSLDLYNNSVKVENYYKNKKYRFNGHYSPDSSDTNKDLDEDLQIFKKKNTLEYGGTTHPLNPEQKTINPQKVKGLLPVSSYRQKVDDNRFYQRETQNDKLDTRAPMALYDKRIKSTRLASYDNIDKKDIMYEDGISIHQYDPIAVKPWQMLTPSEKKARTLRYGTDGTPMYKTKATAKVNTPVAEIKTAKKIDPYKPKSKTDETYRNNMYADSLELYNDNPKYLDKKTIKPYNKNNYSPNYFKNNSTTIVGSNAFTKKRGTLSTYAPGIQVLNTKASNKILPIKEGIGTTDKEGYERLTQGFIYKKPTQKVLDYTPPIAKLNPKQVGVDTNNISMPSKLNTVETPGFKSSNIPVDRAVTKVKYTPSTKPGYENMKEYGTYSKNGDEVDVPKSAIQSKYKNGTMGIKVKKYAPGVNGVKTDDKDNPLKNKSFVGPPTKAQVDDADLDNRLDAVAKETATPAPTYDLKKVAAKNADMDKVRQHQEKLNRYGAGLKVDGMWGEKTEKASKDLYPQYKEQTKTKQSAVASNTPVQAKSTGIKTASNVATISPTITAKSTGPSVNGLGGAIQSNGDVTYSNGRMFNAATKRMENSVKSAGIKTANKPATQTSSKVNLGEVNNNFFFGGDGTKEIPSGKSSPYSIRENGVVIDRKTGERIGEVDKKTGKIYAHGTSRNVEDGIESSSMLGQPGAVGAGKTVTRMMSSKLDTGAAVNDTTTKYKYNPQTAEAADDEEANRYTKKEDKGLDGKDAAIYAAEASLPAIAKKIKNPIGRAAVSALPTLVDIAKTNYDDGFKTPIASTLKATARGVVAGTIGSVAAGTVRRSAKGLTNTVRESNAMNLATEARAARASATTTRERKAANVLMTNARTAVSEANKAKGVNPGIKESASQAFKGTIAGKAVTVLTDNPVVRGIRTLAKTKNNKVIADANKTSRSQRAATKEANRLEAAENSKLAKDGEAIANKVEADAQAKLDKANQEKYGYKSTPTVDRAQEERIRVAENRANNTPSARKRETTAVLAKEDEAYGIKVKARNAEPIPETPTASKPPLLLQQESNSTKGANAQLRAERDVKVGKETRAGIRTTRTENAAREAAANKKAPLLLDAQTPSTKQVKAVEKGITQDAANKYNKRRDTVLGKRAEVKENQVVAKDVEAKRIKTLETEAKAKVVAETKAKTALNKAQVKESARKAKKIKDQVEKIDAKQKSMFNYKH